MIIKSVKARKILDSRKEGTIEISVNSCSSSSPSGKSTGRYETKPYRISLTKSINDINNLNELKGLEINSFKDLAKAENLICKKFKLKSAKYFGANALFTLESAILKALAKSEGKELWQIINSKLKKPKIPVPLGNVAEGGLHAHNKGKPIFQEFLVIPQLNSIKENFKLMKKVHTDLKSKLRALKMSDEGAWQTSLSEEEIFSVLSKIKDIMVGTDIAASSFYKNGKYFYSHNKKSRLQQIEYINNLIKKYKLFYIEDPLEESDFAGFSRIKKGFFKKTLICGDDLTVSNISRFEKALKTKSINALIIKPNQNGSLLEISALFDLCKKNKIKTILSHRSGETLDSALADFAVAFQADFIKCGIATKWREVKLKRLVQIENKL